MSERAILCVQLEHFYARVACLQAGEGLAGKLVAVTQEGRVLDASPEAVAAGLRPGLRVREARRWFPAAVFVPASEEAYPDYARPVLEICAGYTPCVEPETPARIFLDVTGSATLYGPAPEIAGLLARRIPAETGFACRVGGGRSRLVAELAASLGRIVPPGEEPDFLAPLPLARLGARLKPEIAEWLELRGVATLGDLAALPEGLLWRRFGAEGEQLRHLAVGLDPTPVRPAYPPRTVEARVECEWPAETLEQAAQYMTHLAFELARRLRETHDTARRYRLRVSCRNGNPVDAAMRLPAPTSEPHLIHHTLMRLFGKLTPEEPPTGMVAAAEELTPGEAFQGSLFPELAPQPAGRKGDPKHQPTLHERDRDRRLAHVLGLLAARYGPTTVAPGCHLWTSRRPRFIDRMGAMDW